MIRTFPAALSVISGAAKRLADEPPDLATREAECRTGLLIDQLMDLQIRELRLYSVLSMEEAAAAGIGSDGFIRVHDAIPADDFNGKGMEVDRISSKTNPTYY